MTQHSFPIVFDNEPRDNTRIDRVTVAVAPVDAFSGEIVRRSVTAKLKDPVTGEYLPFKPIRNLSGLLVFINLDDQPNYTIEVDAGKAGYFKPVVSVFVPPQPADADQNRRHEVPLFRRPDFAFGEATTLVRGVIKRGPDGVEDARIWADPLLAGNPPFETQSGARGAFVLALRLPKLAPNNVPGPVDVTLKFSEGADQHEFVRPIDDGRTHIFEDPIDLGVKNTPNFIVP